MKVAATAQIPEQDRRNLANHSSVEGQQHNRESVGGRLATSQNSAQERFDVPPDWPLRMGSGLDSRGPGHAARRPPFTGANCVSPLPPQSQRWPYALYLRQTPG